MRSLDWVCLIRTWAALPTRHYTHQTDRAVRCSPVSLFDTGWPSSLGAGEELLARRQWHERWLTESGLKRFPIDGQAAAGRLVLLLPAHEQFQAGVVDVVQPVELDVQLPVVWHRLQAPRPAWAG